MPRTVNFSSVPLTRTWSPRTMPSESARFWLTTSSLPPVNRLTRGACGGSSATTSCESGQLAVSTKSEVMNCGRPAVLLSGRAICTTGLESQALQAPSRSFTQPSSRARVASSSCLSASSLPPPGPPKANPKLAPAPATLMVMSPWLLARRLLVSESPMARPRLRRATMLATPAAIEKTAKSDQRRLRQKLRSAYCR